MSGATTARLRVVAGARTTEARPGVAVELTGVDADARLSVEGSGLTPNCVVELWLASWRQPVRVDANGGFRWHDAAWLRAVAGEVPIRVADMMVTLHVRPTKLKEAELRAILAELEALAAGLSGDLGGRGGHRAIGETPEAALQSLERLAGQVSEASAWIRRSPLARVEVRRRAIAGASRGPQRPADIRWVARSASAIRAAASGLLVGVHTTRVAALDRPENRGVLGVLAQLQRRAEAVAAAITSERERIESSRAARVRFQTSRGSLFDLFDRPRLDQLDARESRLDAVRSELSQARARTGLPRLRPAPVMPRGAAVEAHAGYWNFRRAWEALEGLGPAHPTPTLQATRNLDELYEIWCVVKVVEAIGRWCDEPARSSLTLAENGWYAHVPHGPVAHFAGGMIEVLYEPRVGPGREGEFVRVDGAAELRPDVVVVQRRAGRPPVLHVFDVKHQVGAGPRRAPLEALREIWWKYGEAFGDPQTKAPFVASVWVLYPGRRTATTFKAPGMRSARWPDKRLRGGAIPLAPGQTEELAEVIDLVLRSGWTRASPA